MKRGRKPVTDTHPALLADLGTAPDAQVAAKHGVSAATVGGLRRKHRIPHYGSFAHKLGKTAPDGDPSGLVVYVIRMVGDIAHVLNSHRGIRVYRWGALDPRLLDEDGSPPPLFQSWPEAEAHLRSTGPCCIPLPLARQVFSDVFAPPAYEEDAIREKLAQAARDGRGVTLTADEVAALAGTAG